MQNLNLVIMLMVFTFTVYNYSEIKRVNDREIIIIKEGYECPDYLLKKYPKSANKCGLQYKVRKNEK